MEQRILRVLAAVAVCVALAGSAGAQNKGGGKQKEKGKPAASSVDTSSSAVSHDDAGKPKKKAAKTKPTSRSQHADLGPDDRPPGWDQGGKKGWGDCDVPPGLAKKRGCNAKGYSTRERAELRRQEEVRRRRTTTTTTSTTTTRTTTSKTQSKDGGVLSTIKDQKAKADAKVKANQE